MTQAAYDRLFGQLDAMLQGVAPPAARAGPPPAPAPPERPHADVPYHPKMQDSRCAICLEDFEGGKTVRMLGCFHVFHPDCIAKWDRACPVCKI